MDLAVYFSQVEGPGTSIHAVKSSFEAISIEDVRNSATIVTWW